MSRPAEIECEPCDEMDARLRDPWLSRRQALMVLELARTRGVANSAILAAASGIAGRSHESDRAVVSNEIRTINARWGGGIIESKLGGAGGFRLTVKGREMLRGVRL